MNMLAITLGLFTAICILKRVTAQDIRSTCPATGFTEGLESNFSCTVDTTFYGSCLPVPTLVTFIFSKGGSITPWCSTSYTACETTGQTQTACNGCSCTCSDENPTTNINQYSLKFLPNVNYNGGSFYCEIACVIPSRPETTNHSSCANAKVGQTTTTTTTPTTTVDPCLDYICGHDTQEKVAGCPCDCEIWYCDVKCGDLCWWVYLLIGIAIMLVAFGSCFIIYKCCNTDNLEPRAFARRFCSNLIERVIAGIIVQFIVSAFNRCVRCLDCKRTDNTVQTNEEGKCQASHKDEDTSEHLNGTDNAELRDIDRKSPRVQPSSNSVETRSSKMNQEKLETQEKEEEHSNKSSVARPMVYPNTSISPGKEQREKKHSLPRASIVGIQSTGFTTIPPLPSVNRNSYTKKTDPLPPISKQSNK